MKKCEIQTNLDGGKISSLPLASVFLGPHAENGGNWEKAFSTIFADYMYWRKNYYSKDGFMLSASDIEKGNAFYNEFSIELESMLNDLKQSFPFHSPRYMGHMLSEQSLPAVMGYFATMPADLSADMVLESLLKNVQARNAQIVISWLFISGLKQHCVQMEFLMRN